MEAPRAPRFDGSGIGVLLIGRIWKKPPLRHPIAPVCFLRLCKTFPLLYHCIFSSPSTPILHASPLAVGLALVLYIYYSALHPLGN